MSTTTILRNELMTSVIERVDLALSDTRNKIALVAHGISYEEARERLIELVFARLAKEANI